MAFAAVISLKHTIDSLQNPMNISQITKPANEELKSLASMLKRLDGRSKRSIGRSVINELDAKIRDAVWKLEDVVESYFLYPPSQDDDGVKQEIDSLLKTMKMLRVEYNRELVNLLSGEEDDAGVSTTVDFGGSKSTTVGLSDQCDKIKSQLVDGTIGFKTVSLVGMAGIGKTHLARQIFEDPLIVQHFDYTLWASVGPNDHIDNIFVDVAAQIERKPRELVKEKNMLTLKALLRKTLHGRRYLVVLDDIWSTKVFDYFTVLLPNNQNGSRLLLTTRLQQIAQYYSRAKIHRMQFLNDEESWNLLWQNVFADQSSFPSQLEKAGRKIAEKCEGLPLLILAVANILRGLDKTEEYWNKVAEKKTTTFTDAYDHIYKVLLLSYDHLHQHLKPCFLYLGVFPQSCEIPISKLINLWSVEDFLEPSMYLNLEGFARECLEGLFWNSVVIVCKRRFERVRRIKSCKLHSAYWHLCVTEARKSKFFHVLNKLTDVSRDFIESHRRLSVQNNILFGIKEVYDSMAAITSSTSRSLLCTGEDHQYPVRICFNLMLLKVLDALTIRFYEFPTEALKLLQLRYLALTHNGELPSSISNLQQLQCLILRRHHNIKFPTAPKMCLPEEIWDMQELRHLQIMGSNLPDPSKGSKLPKLSTLHVNAHSCSKDVFKSIPNLKKLGIKVELDPNTGAETMRFLEHIGLLDGLESLKCVVVNAFKLVVTPPDHLSNLPKSLKKLSLKGLGYPWKYMTAIASLPSLEVLKLRCSAFQGPHWETKPLYFPSLQFLLLEDIDLVQWTPFWGNSTIVNHYSFPSLRHLVVRHCYKLKMIAGEIGEISPLKRMEVDECSPSVVESAQQIKNRTKSSDLEVVISSSWNL